MNMRQTVGSEGRGLSMSLLCTYRGLHVQVNYTRRVSSHSCVIIHQEPVPTPWLTSSELTKVRAKRGLGLAKKDTFSVPYSSCLCHEGALTGFQEVHVQRRTILARHGGSFSFPWGAAQPRGSFP